MNVIEVKVPDIGDFKDVPVIEIFVKPGDAVKAEDSLITLESDKATMDVPAPVAGTVKEVKLKLGDKVAEGVPILTLERGEAAASAPQPSSKSEPQPSPASATRSERAGESPPPAHAEGSPPRADGSPPPPRAEGSPAPPAEGSAPLPRAGEGGGEGVATGTQSVPIDSTAFVAAHASPSVRKFARELGVDLARVTGTGPKGRIQQEDVQRFVKQALSGVPTATTGVPGAKGAGLDLLPWPSVDFSKFGTVEPRQLSRIKKISGANLARNWVMIPHVTQFDEADITELEAFRVQLNKENEKSGVKITMLAFLIRASVSALRRFPDFNASLDGDTLVVKHYFNIGFAADTPNGLVVPVIKNADQKGVLQIAREMTDLSAKARDGKLGPADMQGGCFSISSLGGIGGTAFTPIINAPEVAILGVSRSAQKPAWDGNQFVPRLMLPLSLSYDHRVIDGAAAARFCVYLASLLADMRRTVL